MSERQQWFFGVKARYSWLDARHFALIGWAPFIIGSLGMITSNISYFGFSFDIGVFFGLDSFVLTEAMIMIPVFILIGMIFFAGGIEWYVLCRHCPCYEYSGNEHGNKDRFYCLANWGSPKIFKYKPGHISRGAQAVFLIWAWLYAALPILYFWNRLEWVIAQIVIIGVLFITLRHYGCTSCPNFGCILNLVPQENREKFLEAMRAGEIYQ